MAGMLRYYARVRVVDLKQSPGNYDCWQLNRRPPQIGDVGTIVDVLTVPDAPDTYVVEVWVTNHLTHQAPLTARHSDAGRYG
jgi:hypothetical protein